MVDAGAVQPFQAYQGVHFSPCSGIAHLGGSPASQPTRGPQGHTARGNKQCVGGSARMDHSDGGTLVVDSGRPLLHGTSCYRHDERP